MEEHGIVIRLKDGETLFLPKQILTEDSPKFRHLIDVLNFEEIDIDDFSPEAVTVFLTLLEQKQLGEIEEEMFRELHKLGVVFEVEWLKESCRGWLRRKMDHATQVEDKKFTFDESWYILDRLGEKCMVDGLISVFVCEDNSELISEYVLDLNKLKTGQIDILLKLGGSDTGLFFQIILQNLAGQRELNENVKYLLQKMNLALGSEQNEDLYLEVFDTISNLPEISCPDLRLTNQLISAATARLVKSRRERERRRTTTVRDEKKENEQVSSFTTLNDITKALTEDNVTSMFFVVELSLFVYHRSTPSREDTQSFVTSLENICSDKKLPKVSRQFLDTIITALSFSNLSQSDEIIHLLKEIKSNDTLSTFHENVIIKRNKIVEVKKDKKYKHQFIFKHPVTGTCTVTGSDCGFIYKSKKQDGHWTFTLCTDSKDYTNTGIHLHDIISGHDMYAYAVHSGNTPDGTRVTRAGSWSWWDRWLSDITDWERVQRYVAYNVADYLVTKPE